MYFKRTILLGAAFASFCSYPMPAAEASRHASTQTGTTVVNTSPMQAGRTGATTRTFSERIRAILSQSDEKSLSGPARPANVLHQWPVEYKDEGGTLLFSDSPEYVTTEGILYRDTVTGDARVLYYHLNNTDEPKKVAVVLENKYPGPNQVRVTRGGSGAPSEDYLAVGKQGQMDYWGKALDQASLSSWPCLIPVSLIASRIIFSASSARPLSHALTYVNPVQVDRCSVAPRLILTISSLLIFDSFLIIILRSFSLTSIISA